VIFGKYSGNNYKFDSDYARGREKGCLRPGGSGRSWDGKEGRDRGRSAGFC
jgi:hypothetical protein